MQQYLKILWTSDFGRLTSDAKCHGKQFKSNMPIERNLKSQNKNSNQVTK